MDNSVGEAGLPRLNLHLRSSGGGPSASRHDGIRTPEPRRPSKYGPTQDLFSERKCAQLGLSPRKGLSHFSNGRTLSASNLAALSATNLSLQAALPKASYLLPDNPNAVAKERYEDLVRSYYNQITKGCGKYECRNPMCSSNAQGLKLPADICVILSLQLASMPHGEKYLCREHVGNAPRLPREILEPPLTEEEEEQGVPPRPFLHVLFTQSPFASLFEGGPENKPSRSPSPSVPSSNRGRSKSHSHGRDRSLSPMHHSGTDPSQGEQRGLSPLPTNHDETVEDNDGEFSLQYLTLDSLKECVQTYKATGDNAFLVNSLRTIFCSSVALNASFPVNGSSRTPSLVPGNTGPSGHQTARDMEPESDIDTGFRGAHGVNLDHVREAYRIILSLGPHATFQTTMVNSIEILLAQLRHNIILRPADCRQLLILLELPLLDDLSYHEALLGRLCLIFADNIVGRVKKTVCEWLAQYEEHHFTRLVNLFQKFLTLHVHPHERPDRIVTACLSVLEMLVEVNQIGIRSGREHGDGARGIATRDIFYNDHLARKLDFKFEYYIWQKILHPEVKSRDIKVENLAKNLATHPMSFFNYPFLFDPAHKTKILHIDAVVQMAEVFEDAFVNHAWVVHAQKLLEDNAERRSIQGVLRSATCPYLVLEIRRDSIMADTMSQLSKKTKDLKKPLKIKYVNGGEMGLDMGGLQKEFFQLIVDEIFNSSYGMFTHLDEMRSYWFDPDSLATDDEFELVGNVLGLAVYNGIILDVHFPMPVYRKLLGEVVGLQDIKDLDPDLHEGLKQLLEFEGDVENIFCRTFRVERRKFDGDMVQIDLVEHGDDVAVTTENREQFVHLYVNYLLNDSIRRQFHAFYRGFHRICGGDALSLCRPEELELLLCGSPDFDFDALERAATYDDYNESHPVIRWLWQTVRDLTEEEKKLLLVFVTGSDRIPIKGLGNLQFVIQRNGPDSDRLPTAHTCFSRLLLPEYSSATKLDRLLRTAINNGKGFGLI
eukprot:Clim_evm33s239 gene=Clim_evmTU33s239